MKLIVAAVAQELALLADRLGGATPQQLADGPCIYNNLGNGPIGLALVGVGIVSAGLELGRLLAGGGVSQVIMIGSAGALPGWGLEQGQLVVAQSETLAELGLTIGPGVSQAEALNLPGLRQTVAFDATLTAKLAEAVRPTLTAPLLTVAGVSADGFQASFRSQRFGAAAENMEGFALALAGARFGLATAEVRAISNPAGDRDRSKWNLPLAAQNAQEAVWKYLTSGED